MKLMRERSFCLLLLISQTLFGEFMLDNPLEATSLPILAMMMTHSSTSFVMEAVP
jgi:hypothetical protein